MGSRPLLFGCVFGRTFDSTFAPDFTFRGIGVLEGVHVLGEMSVLATPAAEAFNFIAVLGYPLGDDPCPISKRVDLRRNWGSGRPTFLVISTLRLLIDPRPRRGQGNRYPGQSKGGYLWQAS